MAALETAYERVGATHRDFRCCDTSFHIEVKGVRAAAAADAARRTVEELENRLNAFDADSAVARLNGRGAVENEHVARLVHRGLEYHDRTETVFDIHQGRVEHSLKAYLREDDDAVPETFDTGTISISGHHVSADVALDLNGLAKGYIVDRAAEALAGLGRRGFVSGGGDMSAPVGPVAIESPYGDAKPLKILETDWAVATSGNYLRERDGTDHIYDPATERLGSRHESVTVLAERDCMEADALATTLAALPLDEAKALAGDWDGLEALIVHDGVFHTTGGFDAHVLDA
ncbi:MAG: FAD:protein FMN transferase [Haloplanus sp.]